MIYVILTTLLVVAMLVYFRIADRYNIIDKPNERSSHTKITIRGGGVLFVLSMIMAGCIYPEYSLVVFGAIIIGGISFLDDRMTLSGKIRIIFHLFAVSLMFTQLKVVEFYEYWTIPILYIFTIGIINAYNFMDGINGITGLYSLAVLSGLQYVNYFSVSYIEPDMIWLPMIACVVFLFFNFRKYAKCFAGDVGSVSIAFWIVYLLLKLIMETGNYVYILFLAVYGVDAVLTIIHRLILKQNIFEAHRLHFYQLLANEKKISHRIVSASYALLQIVLIIIIVTLQIDFFIGFLVTIVPLVLIYMIFKPGMMKHVMLPKL